MTMMVRTAVIAALLLFGLVSAAPVAAQSEMYAVAAAAQDVDPAEEVVEEEDGGFDDWGLLGLLGLLGLAGLTRKSPQPVVHDADRAGTRTTGRVDGDTLR